ncbi:MAG: hypothetical protein AB1635_05065 [Acidobacteriota bacterium]
MNRRIVALGVAVALAMGVTVAARQGGQGTEPVVPVHEEPRHKKVFEAGSTFILDVQIPPGDTTLFHTHSTAILYVSISRSQTRSQVLGREWSGGSASTPPTAAARPAAAPERLVSSIPGYAAQPQTHRVNNVGTSLFRLIAVSNGSAGGAGVDDETPGTPGTVELVNDFFRAYRVSLAAGAATASHQHKTPVAVVQATSGHTRSEGGATGEITDAGKFVWIPAGTSHALRNAGASGVEIIEVEVRQPR